jgi:hypothetical protein
MTDVNGELKNTNDLLKEVLKNLGAIESKTDRMPSRLGKAAGALKSALTAGGARGNMQGSTNQMSHMEGKFDIASDQSTREYYQEGLRHAATFTATERRLGVAQAGFQATAGIIGGIAAAVPGMAEVAARTGS